MSNNIGGAEKANDLFSSRSYFKEDRVGMSSSINYLP